jgi:hypothetical protein
VGTTSVSFSETAATTQTTAAQFCLTLSAGSGVANPCERAVQLRL